MKITREEALAKIQEMLANQDNDFIETILENLYKSKGIEEVIMIENTLKDPYSMTKEELIEEARILIDEPNKQDFLLERYNTVYTLLKDIAVDELQEDADVEQIEVLVDSWIVGV